MTYQAAQAYKRFQVEDCKKNTDLDMTLEALSDIPRGETEMREKINDAIIEILSEYDWLDPLHETVMENFRLDALEDDTDACELQMNYERETAVMGDTA